MAADRNLDAAALRRSSGIIEVSLLSDHRAVEFVDHAERRAYGRT